MNRINTSRQSVAAKQRVTNYKPNYAMPLHIEEATIELQSSKAVLMGRAKETKLIGRAVVENGRQFFLVQSKNYTTRYFVVVVNKGQWQCSSKDEATCRLMIAKAQAYRNELVEAKKVAVFDVDGQTYEVTKEDGKLVTRSVKEEEQKAA